MGALLYRWHSGIEMVEVWQLSRCVHHISERHKNVFNEWVMDSYHIILVGLVHVPLAKLNYSDLDQNLEA